MAAAASCRSMALAARHSGSVPGCQVVGSGADKAQRARSLRTLSGGSQCSATLALALKRATAQALVAAAMVWAQFNSMAISRWPPKPR